MKSFKEYILSEDIINWYLNEFCKGEYSKNKNGNFSKSNKALSDENIELAKSTFRDDNKGKMNDEAIEAQLAMLTRKAIKDKINDVNRIKNANRKFEKGSLANDVAKKQYDTALSKMDYIEKNEKDKITVNVKNAFKELRASIKKAQEAASVVTEAVTAAAESAEAETNNDGKVKELSAKLNDKIIKIAEIADKALENAGVDLGDLYKNGTDGDRDEISTNFVNFITELCKGTDFISNDDDGAIIRKIKKAARDNKLNRLEAQDFLSKSPDLKQKPTNLKFIIALLWFKTVAPELYKDSLTTEIGNVKSNSNIPESVRSQYEKMVKGLGELTLDKDFLKVLGDKLEDFSVIPFKAKVEELCKSLWKKLTPTEEEEVKKLQGRNVSPDPDTNANDEIKNQEETKPEEVKDQETAKSEETKPEETKPEETKPEEKKGYLINKLTFNSSKEEIDEAIAEVFGVENPNKDNPEEYGKIYNNLISFINEKKEENDKLYKSSLHPKEELKEDIFAQAYEELLKEGIGLQKLKNAMPKFGKFNLDKNRESIEETWQKCIDELEKTRRAYLAKATTIAADTEKIHSIEKRKGLIYNLKKLFSDFNTTMYDTYARGLKGASYNAIGRLGHDIRNDFHAFNEKRKEFQKNSKAGQLEAVINAEIEKKINNLNVKTLEEIPENFRDEFAYAVLSKNTKAALYEKVTGTNETILKALRSALNNSKSFVAGDDAEIEAFIDKLAASLKEKPEVKDWLMKYYEQYTQNKSIEPLRKFIANASKLLPAIKQKIRGREDVDKLLESHRTFKDWLILKEGVMDTASNNAMNGNNLSQQTKTLPEPQFSDAEKIATAIAVVIDAVATGHKIANELKEKAVQKILNLTSKSVQIKLGLTKETIEKGIEGYVEKHRGEIVPAMTTFNDKLNISINSQGYVPNNPKPTPEQKPVNSNQNNEQPASQSAPESSVQATVTTAAVGDYKIPDRLTKRLIRRKIGSFV